MNLLFYILAISVFIFSPFFVVTEEWLVLLFILIIVWFVVSKIINIILEFEIDYRLNVHKQFNIISKNFSLKNMLLLKWYHTLILRISQVTNTLSVPTWKLYTDLTKISNISFLPIRSIISKLEVKQKISLNSALSTQFHYFLTIK